MPVQNYKNMIFCLPTTVHAEIFYTNGKAVDAFAQLLVYGMEIQNGFWRLYFPRAGLYFGYDIALEYDKEGYWYPVRNLNMILAYNPEKFDKKDTDTERRLMAYKFKAIREQTGMNRKDFSNWLGIPYRTMQEWELGRRVMPEYVLRLIAYKVANEKQKGRFDYDS